MSSVQVILQDDITHLGDAGEVVKVKPGYARNYLLRFGHAVLASVENLLKLRDQRAELKRQAAERRSAALELAERLKQIGSIELAVKVGPTGKLFGRITTHDLAAIYNERLGEAMLSNRMFAIPDSPKGLDEQGSYDIIADLNYGVTCTLKVKLTEG